MRHAGRAAAAALLILTLPACSGAGGKTTCAEFAQLNRNDRVLVRASDEQNRILKDMLDSHGKATDAANMGLAWGQVIDYCGMLSGEPTRHEHDPIENIPGLT